jgi:hypothetical protein
MKGGKMEGYCVKCKAKREMKDVKIVQTARGGYMARGSCSTCGTGMCRIMSKDNAEKAVTSGEAEKAY